MKMHSTRIILCLMAVSLCVSLDAVRPPRKVAAGILPYAYDMEGTPYFLLGQEPNGEWSDFGGKADRHDLNSKMTAMREFSEETRCVFGMYGKMVGRTGAFRHGHAQMIYNRPVTYPRCMKLSNRYIEGKMGRPLVHPRGYYVMYLAWVSFLPEQLFNNAAKIPHYEKQQYAWVDASKFIGAVRTSKDRRNTWFEHKKMRAPFIDMIKTYADEILKTIGGNRWQTR